MSFLEIGIVILLLFVLFVGGMYLFGGRISEARDSKRIKNFQTLEKVPVDEFAVNGAYPTEEEFESMLRTDYKQLNDPADGDKICLEDDGETLRKCGYIYRSGNRGFDYLLIGFFETPEYVVKTYDDYSLDREWLRGYVQGTKTSF